MDGDGDRIGEGVEYEVGGEKGTEVVRGLGFGVESVRVGEVFEETREVDEVKEEKGKEDESGKSIGIDNKDKVIHSFGHCCFAQCA